jgi:phosphatidylinositol kinase/protein kinase (PI-3  family)
MNAIPLDRVIGTAYFQQSVELSDNSKSHVLEVHGTDRRIYKHALNGKQDDLRHDSVMLQLFVLSSRVLHRRNRTLTVRCCCVSPPPPWTGVLEFVERAIYVGD